LPRKINIQKAGTYARLKHTLTICAPETRQILTGGFAVTAMLLLGSLFIWFAGHPARPATADILASAQAMLELTPITFIITAVGGMAVERASRL
jgi:hypothetical protein